MFLLWRSKIDVTHDLELSDEMIIKIFGKKREENKERRGGEREKSFTNRSQSPNFLVSLCIGHVTYNNFECVDDLRCECLVLRYIYKRNYISNLISPH